MDVLTSMRLFKVPTIRHASLAAVVVATAVCVSVTHAAPQQSGTDTLTQPPRTSFRPDIRKSAPPLSPPTGDAAVKPAGGVPSGDTYVAVASGLSRVFRGYEPRSVEALKLLQEQQTQVVEAVEKVTVNVQQGRAQGSGVVITENGYILTAAHVAGRPGLKASVHFSDGTSHEAITLGMNRDLDAGLMRIVGEDGRKWPHASVASVGDGSDLKIREGQWCIAAGYPGGWDDQRGMVVRVGRILRIMKGRSGPHTIKTDCALIGGDSGGPLFSLDGRLIAVHSRIGSDINDNMHVPVNVFSAGWDRMVAGDVWGTLPGYRPVIGVRGNRDARNALIESVTADGPAARAGMQKGDIVLSVDGRAISNFKDLQDVVLEALPGDVLSVMVLRGEQRLRLRVRVMAAG